MLNQQRGELDHAASKTSFTVHAIELTSGANYKVSGCGADGS